MQGGGQREQGGGLTCIWEGLRRPEDGQEDGFVPGASSVRVSQCHQPWAAAASGLGEAELQHGPVASMRVPYCGFDLYPGGRKTHGRLLPDHPGLPGVAAPSVSYTLPLTPRRFQQHCVCGSNDFHRQHQTSRPRVPLHAHTPFPFSSPSSIPSLKGAWSPSPTFLLRAAWLSPAFHHRKPPRGPLRARGQRAGPVT